MIRSVNIRIVEDLLEHMKSKFGDGRTAQQAKVLAAEPNDLGSIIRTHLVEGEN